MIKHILPVFALLLGSGFLFFAGGMNGLILPVRGSAEGFSAISLGLLGTGWAIGYILGCIRTPAVVARVGHIRAFSAMAALAALSVLLSSLIIEAWAWILLRSLAGFAFAGAAMIVESWLTEQSEAKSRGTVFGVYTMVNLGASTLGQMSLAAGNSTGFEFFVIAAIFYCLALLPTAISATTVPQPLTEANLDLKGLWNNSPVAVIAVIFVGISNSAFGTLGAVYAEQSNMDIATIALFMSAPILAGAAAQIPVGIVSDRVDRRGVLIGITVLAIAADVLFLTANLQAWTAIVVAAIFGASVFSMYPVLVAHANDHAPQGSGIKVSGGLLLLYGVGGIAGPLIAGFAMNLTGPHGLFVVTIVTHICIIGYTFWRMLKRAAVEQQSKGTFVITTPLRTTTQQTFVLSELEDEEGDR